MPKTAHPPDAASLHEAALRHLARYACSAAALTRVLDRRVGRWARAVEAVDEDRARARETVRQVIGRLAAAGVLDDAAYAAGRARSLVRAGRSRRAIAAHLAARGVESGVAGRVLPDDPEHELAAALTVARRRRIGPFRATASIDPASLRRELAALARGGFAEGLARQILSTERDDAEALLLRLRRDR